MQPFVKKCFEAVKEFRFEPGSGEISGMTSVEGEYIGWIETVNPAATGELRALRGMGIQGNDGFMCSEGAACSFVCVCRERDHASDLPRTRQGRVTGPGGGRHAVCPHASAQFRGPH